MRYVLIHAKSSILFDRQKKMRFGLATISKKVASKIYVLLGIKRRVIPDIVNKLCCLNF